MSRRGFKQKKTALERLPEKTIRIAERIYSKKIQEIHERFSPIFRAGLKFMELDPSTRYIFLGQSMRPFYETVWHLNQIEKRIPPQNLVYYVLPRTREESIKTLEKQSLVKEQLKQRNIVEPSQARYCVVDYCGKGRVRGPVKKAIRSLLKNANVSFIDQDDMRVGEGVWASENYIVMPTEKKTTGEVYYPAAAWTFGKRYDEYAVRQAQFVLFKSALYNFIREHQRRKNKL